MASAGSLGCVLQHQGQQTPIWGTPEGPDPDLPGWPSQETEVLTEVRLPGYLQDC